MQTGRDQSASPRDRVSDGSALWDAMGAADSPVIEIVFNTDPYIDSHRPFGSTSVYINVEVPRDGAVMNMPGDYTCSICSKKI